MALSEQTKDLIKSVAASIAVSAGTKVVVAVVKEGIKKLTVTNYEKKGLKGNKSITPTDDITTFDKRETSAAQTDAAILHDDVQAQSGQVQAADTKAQALETTAKAAEAGAKAVDTEAGATEIATKALKMN